MALTLKEKGSNPTVYIRVSNDEAAALVAAGTHHAVPKKGPGRPVGLNAHKLPARLARGG